jgi:hypothetical protein
MPANTHRDGKRVTSYYKHYWHNQMQPNKNNRCAGHGYYRAESVDKAMWGYVSELVSEPAILSDAFKEYGERLQSGNSPTRDKLETAQKRLTSTERKLSRLLDVYLDEAISKKQYAARKKPLEIQLEGYSDDVGALSQELEQSTKLEEHMQSITEFTEAVATGLEQDKGIAHRREVIKRLGLRAELGQDDISRYVDAVFCFANERNPDVHATYSALITVTNNPAPIIFRKRLRLPQRRIARKAVGAA